MHVPGVLLRMSSIIVERASKSFDIDARPSVPELAGVRQQIVCPGDVVPAEPGTLRGLGIIERDDGKFVATTCGVVESVNKLLYIKPLTQRYGGSIGDVVVGRIVEVQQERWSVDIGAPSLAHLHLTAIHLQGNVQRRRTDEDLQHMREFYQENDIISAEVQKVHESGEIALQTRTARYGKLQNGVLVCVPSVNVRRRAQHLVTLPQVGVMMVLGNNGWIWVCSPPKVEGSGRQETLNFSQLEVKYDVVPPDLRKRICRIRNTLYALVALGFEVMPETVGFLYELSLAKGLTEWELLDPARCVAAGLMGSLLGEG